MGGGTLHRKNIYWKGETAHTLLIGGTIGVWTPHNIERKSLAAGGWVRAAAGAGGRKFCQIIMPLRGSILQAETCQIPSLAENPTWSRMWKFSLLAHPNDES